MNQANPLPVIIYSERYNMDLGLHVFPAVKFGHIARRLRGDARFKKHRIVEPQPLSREQARLAHSRSYLDDLLRLQVTRRTHRSELPLNQEIVDAFMLSCGGTLDAARAALEGRSAINLGGGFHHAFRDHAEGFCYLNDVAIAVRTLQKEQRIKRALIIDLDVHQGNGTARIFRYSRHVFTFSMHEENNYPVKEKGSLDVGLRSGCGDEEYLETLGASLESIRQQFEPDLVVYVAGVDVYMRDRLGGLAVSREGLARRDQMVRDAWPDVPLAAVLAGGYAINDEETVDLHFQTCEVLAGFK
ncbi:MAG: histone deacetylase [Leptospirales bacterium]|nr:histone deacetylase [Leptospirales bacterium]